MIGFILDQIISPFWPYIAAAGAAALAYFTGRSSGAAKAKAKQAEAVVKADRQAHERMNHADDGAGASDDERIERLRDFAAKHGNGQAKAGGGKMRGGTR